MSDMLNAFVSQTYDPHGGIIAYEDKCLEVVAQADEIHGNWVEEAQEQLGRSQELAEYVTILTDLKKGDLNENAESHSQFANYDHSLEMDRLAKLREKYDYVPPENSNVDLSEMEMSTEPYENISPEEVPNLSGLFDDVFGLE
jgi:hypothetical protein